MLATLLALSLVIPSADAKGKELSDAAKKELKKLEGKWEVTKALADGNELTPPEGQKFIEFKGQKFFFGDKEVFSVASLDPATDPKCLDFKAVADMGEIRKDTVYEGIYKLDGDTLTIALYFGEGNKRPAKFESAAGSKIVVVTFKREKK